MPLSRRQIIRACKQRGWLLQPDALQGMETYLRDDGQNEKTIDDLQFLLDMAASNSPNKKTLTGVVWQRVVDSIHGQLSNDSTSSDETANAPVIVSGFQTPCLVYDNMKKTFSVDLERGPLFGSVQDKVSMMGLLLLTFFCFGF